MEWNISYHPLKESEIRDCYFSVLDSPNLEKRVVQQYEITDACAQRLSEVYQTARMSQSAPFQTSHGFSLAVVAGFLRKYWYVHGPAFASVFEKDFRWMGYSRPWKSLIPLQYQHRHIVNRISTPCSSGVYLSFAGIQRLRANYAGDARLWAILEDTFSHGRLAIFWQAVNYAIEHETGLLEASDVIVPDPLNSNNTHCYSNLLHCEQNGIALYQETVAQQSSSRPSGSSDSSEEALYADLTQPVWLR